MSLYIYIYMYVYIYIYVYIYKYIGARFYKEVLVLQLVHVRGCLKRLQRKKLRTRPSDSKRCATPCVRTNKVFTFLFEGNGWVEWCSKFLNRVAFTMLFQTLVIVPYTCHRSTHCSRNAKEIYRVPGGSRPPKPKNSWAKKDKGSHGRKNRERHEAWKRRQPWAARGP